MDVNEALQWADQWTEGHTFYEGMQGWRVVCATLAAEVRRLRVPAVEAVPLGYALANLDGTIRNHGDGELMVYRNPFSRSDKTDCIPLYMHPPSLDDDTRKLVLELLDELDTYSLDPYLSRRSKEIVKILKEKLGAGE